MIRGFIYFLLFAPFLVGYTQDSAEVYLPTTKNGLIINHLYFSLSYQTEYKQAEWVSYQIFDSTAFGSTKRKNNFREDPETKDIELKPFYAKSGYDRGHLCPAGSMAFNSTAMSESFYMSNMSPKVPGFNRGIWKKLESQVRTWGYQNHHIHVITGPILNQFIDTIGIIPVPKRYFKVILDYQEPEFKAIGFVLENASSKKPLKQFAVPVDSVESLTGIDFFNYLPDSIESDLEGDFNTKLWTWKSISIKNTKIESTYQCIAITGSGKQCSRITFDSNSFCWQHQTKTTEQMVWVCGKSKIYHMEPDHASLKRCKSGIVKIRLKDAINKGLRECKD